MSIRLYEPDCWPFNGKRDMHFLVTPPGHTPSLSFFLFFFLFFVYFSLSPSLFLPGPIIWYSVCSKWLPLALNLISFSKWLFYIRVSVCVCVCACVRVCVCVYVVWRRMANKKKKRWLLLKAQFLQFLQTGSTNWVTGHFFSGDPFRLKISWYFFKPNR